MLEVNNLTVKYGKTVALSNVSFSVSAGEIVTIIGANGAGKTTTVRTISGLVKPETGNITFNGSPITGMESSKIVKMGIAQVPQNRLIFADQPVLDNIILGAYLRKDRESINQDIKEMLSMFPILAQRQKQMAGTLSGGEQQMLAIARALMSKPKLLLLDEPSLGLAPLIINSMFEVIQKLKERGMTILLVEQMAYKALQVADRAYVMENGHVIMEGLASELLENEEVKAAYLS